jgi:hypothetical protein
MPSYPPYSSEGNLKGFNLPPLYPKEDNKFRNNAGFLCNFSHSIQTAWAYKREISKLHVVLLQVLCIPHSWDGLAFPGFQVIGSFTVAFNHSVRSFPFGIKLPFSGISGHHPKLSEYPISDSKFPGVNRLVIVPGHSGSVSFTHCLRVVSPFLQQIETQTNSFVIMNRIVLRDTVARGPNLDRYYCLGSICQ